MVATDQYEGSDGGRNQFAFTVRITGECSISGSVGYRTVDGTAEAGSDYTATAGTISWARPGSHSVLVPVTRDADPESDEDFSVELFAPRNVIIDDSTATATVFNDDLLFEEDFPGVETAIEQGGICWWPNDTYFKLPLRVNVTPRAPITVQLYGKDGTAVAGKHYELVQPTVTFAEGVDRTDLPIKILSGPDDPKQELHFSVVIKEVSAGTVVGRTAKITIRQG